jgi:ABC-type antimicrobial peptide transport system permease subunit
MGHGIRFVVIGLMLGIVMAAGAMRLLSTMLFGVASTDATVFGQVVLAVAVASLLASFVPARRAGKMAMEILKAE